MPRGLAAGSALMSQRFEAAAAAREPPKPLLSPGFPVAATPARAQAPAVRLPICRPEGTSNYCEMASNSRIGAGCVCWDLRDRPGRVDAAAAAAGAGGQKAGETLQKLPGRGFPK